MTAVPPSKAVVFDIFDTLVTRPLLNPKDLFRYMEEAWNAPGFAAARVETEHSSRDTVCREVNLSEIYGEMPEQYRHLMEAEIEAEVRIARPDMECRALYEELKAEGRKIYLASDMYLEPPVVERILEACGYSGWDGMFISCDRRISKNSGGLYKVILEETGIPAEDFLVIGDSEHSDVRRGSECGMKTFLWTSLKDRYAKSHPREMKLAAKHPEASPLVGTDMILWQEGLDADDYWGTVGARFGGPMAVNFSIMVRRALPADTQRIFFYARDGYVPYRTYTRMFPDDGRTAYLHTSRLISKSFRVNHPSNNKDEMVSILTYLDDTGRSEALGIPRGLPFGERVNLVMENREKVLEVLAEGRRNYITYIRSLTQGDTKVVYVDTTTKNFTSQRIIDELVPEIDSLGIYYAVTGKWDVNQEMYCDRRNQHLSSTYINLAETFFAASAAPVRDFSPEGEPLFPRPMNEGEKRRDAYAKLMFAGEDRYTDLFVSLWGDHMPFVPGKTMDRWVDILVANEKANRDDPSRLGGMKWYVDTGHRRCLHAILRKTDIIKALLWKGSSLLYKLHIRR